MRGGTDMCFAIFYGRSQCFETFEDMVSKNHLTPWWFCFDALASLLAMLDKNDVGKHFQQWYSREQRKWVWNVCDPPSPQINCDQRRNGSTILHLVSIWNQFWQCLYLCRMISVIVVVIFAIITQMWEICAKLIATYQQAVIFSPWLDVWLKPISRTLHPPSTPSSSSPQLNVCVFCYSSMSVLLLFLNVCLNNNRLTAQTFHAQPLTSLPSEGCPTTGGASGCPKCFIQSARNAANPREQCSYWAGRRTLRVRGAPDAAAASKLLLTLNPAPIFQYLSNCPFNTSHHPPGYH